MRKVNAIAIAGSLIVSCSVVAMIPACASKSDKLAEFPPIKSSDIVNNNEDPSAPIAAKKGDVFTITPDMGDGVFAKAKCAAAPKTVTTVTLPGGCTLKIEVSGCAWNNATSKCECQATVLETSGNCDGV